MQEKNVYRQKEIKVTFRLGEGEFQNEVFNAPPNGSVSAQTDQTGNLIILEHADLHTPQPRQYAIRFYAPGVWVTVEAPPIELLTKIMVPTVEETNGIVRGGLKPVN